MSKKTIKQLFGQKAEDKKAVLGNAKGDVVYDNEKDRLSQLFENGIVMCGRNASKSADLICIYGKIFHAWNDKDANWLGDPLGDCYETVNREGVQIIVQRFKSGVVWCQSDGSGDVSKLSWRDWHAISTPGRSLKSCFFLLLIGVVIGVVIGLVIRS